MKNLKVLTQMHLTAAKKMPRKTAQALYGKAAEKYERWLRKERKDIARYYRLLRSGTVADYTSASARVSHRYAVVTTGAEARVRVKNLTAAPSEVKFN